LVTWIYIIILILITEHVRSRKIITGIILNPNARYIFNSYLIQCKGGNRATNNRCKGATEGCSNKWAVEWAASSNKATSNKGATNNHKWEDNSMCIGSKWGADTVGKWGADTGAKWEADTEAKCKAVTEVEWVEGMAGISSESLSRSDIRKDRDITYPSNILFYLILIT
jgi:hypothetical protein